MFLKFAYPELFFIFVPILLLAIVYRLFLYRSPRYMFPSVAVLGASGLLKGTSYKHVLMGLRFLALCGLLLMIARPQWIDEQSFVNVNGVDIVLAIDVSGSMQLFDDMHDRRSRIQVAKQEAINFIEKRTNDPISVVIFAHDALSRSPLTLDKKFLKDIVGSLELGVIDPNGTFLGTGLATAVSRLKTSAAKSKIVILLTDGAPSVPEKIDPETAIELAKQFDVKVYTIGIGNQQGGFIQHPFLGIQRAGVDLNVALLQKIAQETNGRFFVANNPRDMRTIYDTIDQLERTEHKTDMFHNYYEAFLSFIWAVLLLFGIELLLRFFVWRGVS